ncbi:unnamed protein product [Ectocarpus sp. CCAP 1310/34]|nr:unnamed protein product [Ectocarpus sp. CCAP 1310/34]
MEVSQDEGFVVIDLEQLGREGVMAGYLPALEVFCCPCHLLEAWHLSQPSSVTCRWPLRHSSMMSGFWVGDLVLSRALKNLAHRWRMSSLFRSNTPFSSAMNCCPPGCLPLRSTDLLRCWYSPRMSRSL